jgi:sialate O-acetylesterase
MKRPLLFCFTLMLACTGAPSVQAAVKLPAVFGSHMVLQRDQDVPIWGWADPGEKIRVEFDGQKLNTSADDKGNWKVVLKPMKANAQARTMNINGNMGEGIKLDDILVGEVWLGSGQSNMEWSVNASYEAKKVKEDAKHPNIRLFHVPKIQVKSPAQDVKATWKVCAPETVGNFSAVLYHFGVDIQKEVDVPVGLINSSWGGSPIEPWIVKGPTSGGMYNGMIAPVHPFAVRGILWYQGESNVGNGMKYFDKMKDLIEGWRQKWGQDMPFYFVQIAPWSGYKASLPDLWEAQVASLKIPGTGMVVCTDLVDKIGDIHPGNKKEFGHRLALIALAKTYGKKDLVYSGPLYKEMKVEGNKIRISFAHTGTGLKARNSKELTLFEIAGEDGKFVPARAEIDGKTVVVSAENLANPTQVRFGWTNTAIPNLVNSAGLPASPFRTKNWQGVTGE